MTTPTTSATGSTRGAREHARAQAATASPQLPALPDGVTAEQATWLDRVPAESYTTAILARGTRLRLTDPDGAACAHVFLMRADAPWERFNVADTVKVPWQAYPGVGHPLLSDQGRLLATVVADTSGHHDALCGPSSAGRDLLCLAAAKYGRTARDIGPSVSFFRGVRVAADGTVDAIGSASSGAHLELLLQLPLIVLIANSVHPLDPRPVTDLDIVARPGDPAGSDSGSDPEYLRALAVTEQVWAAAQNREEWT